MADSTVVRPWKSLPSCEYQLYSTCFQISLFVEYFVQYLQITGVFSLISISFKWFNQVVKDSEGKLG